MAPWAEVNSILSNMRSLVIKAEGKKISGTAELSIDDGHVILDFSKKRKKT
jgi:hypothetical protein